VSILVLAFGSITAKVKMGVRGGQVEEHGVVARIGLGEGAACIFQEDISAKPGDVFVIQVGFFEPVVIAACVKIENVNNTVYLPLIGR